MNIKGDISISGNRPPKRVQTNGRPETWLRLFQILIDTAVAGERCPVLQEFTDKYQIPSGYSINKLVDLGWIRSEVYTRNWRVIEICVGDHKGARTKECPHGGKPYKTFVGPPADEK